MSSLLSPSILSVLSLSENLDRSGGGFYTPAPLPVLRQHKTAIPSALLSKSISKCIQSHPTEAQRRAEGRQAAGPRRTVQPVSALKQVQIFLTAKFL